MRQTAPRVSLIIVFFLLLSACGSRGVVEEPQLTRTETVASNPYPGETAEEATALPTRLSDVASATVDVGGLTVTPQVGASATVSAPDPVETSTSTLAPSPLATVILPTETRPAPTETVAAEDVAPGFDGQSVLIVDHSSVADFDRIPEEYIQAAAALRMVFINLSVGRNIDEGLDCLSYSSNEQAPNHCIRFEHNDPQFSLDRSEVSWERAGGYDRSNWEFWTYRGRCTVGQWEAMASCFEQMVDPVIADYDVLSYQFTYLDVNESSSIADEAEGFFAAREMERGGNILDQEAYEAQYPEKVFIYWTTSLARSIGTEVSDRFNEQMRQYAIENGKPLFDVASILSHDPYGNPCYDNRDGLPYEGVNDSENFADDGEEYLAICQHYTTETEGGHLGSVSAGKIRVAKAFWVLMARLAGWDGSPDG